MNGEQVEAYDICLGGRLGADAKFTRAIERKVPADKVKFAIANLLRAFQKRRSKDEDFSAFVDRHSDEELGSFLGVQLLLCHRGLLRSRLDLWAPYNERRVSC